MALVKLFCLTVVGTVTLLVAGCASSAEVASSSTHSATAGRDISSETEYSFSIGGRKVTVVGDESIRKESNGAVTFENVFAVVDGTKYRIGAHRVIDRDTSTSICSALGFKYASTYFENTSLWINRKGIEVSLAQKTVNFFKLDSTGSYVAHLRCTNYSDDRIVEGE